jgi:hypothetical protein
MIIILITFKQLFVIFIWLLFNCHIVGISAVMLDCHRGIWKDVLNYQSWTSLTRLHLCNYLINSQITVKLMILLFVSINKLIF